MTFQYPTATVELGLDDDPTANYEDFALTLSLLSYYRLDDASGSLLDSSGNGVTMTVLNGANLDYAQPGSLSGDADTAVNFDNSGFAGSPSGAWAQSAAASVTYPSAGFTVDLWVKRRVTGERHPIGGLGVFLLIDTDDLLKAATALTAAGAPSGAGDYVQSTQTLDTNWHHVAFVYSGTSEYPVLYIDGVDVTSPTKSTTWLLPTTLGGAAGRNFVAQAGTGGTTVYFDGRMDEIASYPVALTAAQVDAHYQSARIHNPLVWTDVSAYFLGGSQNRGRSQELDTVGAGQATVRLRNTDRRFDPTNADGPYYGKLLPMRRLRLKWTVNSVTYTRFVGFVEGWPQTWDGPNWSEVELTVVDGFEQLAQTDISSQSWGEESPGARIGHVLDAALWPRSDRSIDTGYATVPATAFTAGQFVSALQHIQDVASGDLGQFFIALAGDATFHDRYHRAGAASAAEFGDAGSGFIPYAAVKLDPASRDYILNDVTTTADGGTPQQVEEGASIVSFFRRSASRQVLTTTDLDAHAQSALLVGTHKDPSVRVPAMTLVPTTVAQWEQVLGREIGDRVTVYRQPMFDGDAVGDPIEVECFLEGPSDDFNGPRSWVARWALSPVTATASGWILGDPYESILGETTVLA